MKKFNFLKPISFAVVATICLGACKKDDDKNIDQEAPVIKTVSIKALSGSEHITPGDTLYFECQIDDNEGVSSAKVEIHLADDGHSHRVLTDDLEFNKVFNLEGKISGFSYKLFLPLNTTIGEYHFNVQAIDLSGNESKLSVTEFDIEEK